MTKTYFDDDVVITPKRGYGLKFGNKSIANNSSTERFGWRDITGQITLRGVGAADPTWAQIGTSAFYAYKFDLNDSVFLTMHVPHDYVPDTDIFFHAHWLSDGTETASVRWEYTYMYARGFSQDAFNTSGTVVYSEEGAAGVAYTHHVTESDAVTVANLDEPDGIVYYRIRRVANTDSPQVDNTDAVFLLTSDIHYQSSNLGTVNKAPRFYIGG